MDWKKLREPFAPEDIEWRVGQCGMGGKGLWARVFAYMTNRAVMDRLDEVCGPENWKCEHIDSIHYDAEGRACGHVRCILSVRIDGEWISKDDAAPLTDFESVKGGYSDSMKRAAVQFGIGRYLYSLPPGWADICDDGAYYQPADKKRNIPDFKWNPPELPDEFLPRNWQHKTPQQVANGVAAQVPGIKVGLPEIKWSPEFTEFFAEVQKSIKDLPEDARAELGTENAIKKRLAFVVINDAKVFRSVKEMAECNDQDELKRAASAWFDHIDRLAAFT